MFLGRLACALLAAIAVFVTAVPGRARPAADVPLTLAHQVDAPAPADVQVGVGADSPPTVPVRRFTLVPVLPDLPLLAPLPHLEPRWTSSPLPSRAPPRPRAHGDVTCRRAIGPAAFQRTAGGARD